MTTGAMSQHAVSCQGLIYSVLQNPLSRTTGRGFVAALVAAHPGAGTTHLTDVLSQSLNGEAAESALPLDGRELATLCAEPRNSLEGDGRGIRPTTGRSSSAALQAGWSWRGSQDYRAAYLEQLRARYSYVLIDCPSLKESTEVLGLAPVVDGILLVIEANKTQKAQVAYLERTIEAAGGKVLGHLLNKRSYPIPSWLFNKLERWGT